MARSDDLDVLTASIVPESVHAAAPPTIEPVPAYSLTSIAEQIESRRSGTCALVVAVDGPSGSGKTRLAKRIGRALGEHTVVRMDHVVAGWDGLEQSTHTIRGVLEQLRAGRAVRYRMWDWARQDWGEELARPASATVMVEGCGSGALSLCDLTDFLVWVDAPHDVRQQRAINRDGASYEPHWERWAAQEDAHYAANRTRERADLIIDGRLPVR